MPKEIIIILLILIALTAILFVVCIIRAALNKKAIRVLRISPKINERDEKYAQDLLTLLKIKTKSYEDQMQDCPFLDRMASLFPLVKEKMKVEKFGSHLIMTYSPKNPKRNILFLVNRGEEDSNQPYLTDNEVYGMGAYRKKAIIYATLRAVEELFQENNDLNIGITIFATIKKTVGEKDEEFLANQFLKKGNYFDLVLKDGAGIIDPTFLEMKSTFAIIGTGVTGEIDIRYKVKKTLKSKESLLAFISELKITDVFPIKISKKTDKLLSSFAADMPFFSRFIFSNIEFFRPIVRRIIKLDKTDLSKLIKTLPFIRDIKENEDNYYCDVSFQLSHYDSLTGLVKALKPYVEKYDIDYEIALIREESPQTSTKCWGYPLVRQTVEENFKDLHVTNHFLTKSSLQLRLNNISDCIVWFNPLYYPYDAIVDANNNNEHILKKSLTMGIDFYKSLVNKISEGENVL